MAMLAPAPGMYNHPLVHDLMAMAFNPLAFSQSKYHAYYMLY
jgi:hypothetical protein